MPSSTRYLAASTLVAMLAACSNASGPGGGNQISFQLATRAAASAAPGLAAALAGAEEYVVGNDTIDISSAQVVLREIEFKRVSDAGCAPGTAGDPCEELEVGPVLLDLPLGAGAQRQFTVAVDTGTFDRLEFKVHKPESDPGDNAFIQAHPDFAGVSIKVSGTFNSQPFTYTSDLDAEQESDLVPPLQVTDNAGTQVTLMVDLGRWFLNASATALVDPSTANVGGQNEGLVKNNIEAGFQSFEDRNADGLDDHGTH